jgi:hypothetical protein
MRRVDSAFLKAYRANALTAQGGFCRYCLRPLSRAEVTADHRIPRHAGGPTKQGNIAAACGECNRAKGHMSEAAFLSAIKGSASVPWHLLMVRFTRRLWQRTHLASKRIRCAAGLEFHGPKSGAAA